MAKDEMKRFLKELMDDAKEKYTSLRQEFRSAIDMSPTARKVALEFHRATMTDDQLVAYLEIKKTKSVYVDKKKSVPAYTVDAGLRAKDAAKAIRILELEQPEDQDGILVKWKCADAKETTTKMRRKWF